ncbi:MAG TPA: membrane protein insertase YidC [Gryllotalpicola sp.]
MFDSGPLAAILDAGYHGVLALTGLLTPFAGAAAAALAIVLLTLAVRAALIPVGVSTVRAMFNRARIAPQLDELRKRYGKDPQKYQQKMLELHRSEGVSPFAGILPLLAQAPVLSFVYTLFLHERIAGHANALLGHTVLGTSLGESFRAALAAGDGRTLLVTGGLLAVLAAVIAVQRRVLMASAPAPAVPPQGAGAAITRVSSYLGFITVVFAAFVPLAAGLYLLTTTVWTTVERGVVTALLRPSPPPAATPPGSAVTAARS